MAKRPTTHKETFKVEINNELHEREILHAEEPTATYRFGLLRPHQTEPGRWDAEIWCKSKDDRDFVALALSPSGNHVLASYVAEAPQ